MGKMTSLNKLSGIKSKSTDTAEAAIPESSINKSEVMAKGSLLRSIER